MTVNELVTKQRQFFESGVTRFVDYRKEGLERLQRLLAVRQDEAYAALKADLNKSKYESELTELSMVRSELRLTLRRLHTWAKPKKVATPLTLMPSKSMIYPDPYGVVLIMSPWNYPYQLCLLPLISALAAGNCVVLKPSAYAPATSAFLASLMGECFPPEYVSVVEGGRNANTGLLAQKFDMIFFTGSPDVGKTVLESAAKNLTPAVLELGGKSPCIIDETADIELAAKRIAAGKGFNAGQTCIAPDYVLIARKRKDFFLECLQKYFVNFYGENPCESEDWPQIINEKHFDRLQGLMAGESIVHGGEYRAESLKIAPTVLDNVSFDSPVMQEEIFGPILPVIPFDHPNEALSKVRSLPKPLAVYLFSRDTETTQWLLNNLSFGGGCVNDTLLHTVNPNLPFGGVGNSGMGNYHGKAGFNAFTHQKSVFYKGSVDTDLRYPPFTNAKYERLKRLMK